MFYMAICKTRRERVEYQYCATVPDIDNLQKLLLDSLVKSKIIFDDRYVSSITAKKLYSKKPRTEITITELDLCEKVKGKV